MPQRVCSAYYAAIGTPPGRFLGAGLNDGNGIKPGEAVTGEHPVANARLAAGPCIGAQLGQLSPVHRTRTVDHLGLPKKPPQTVAGSDLLFSAPKSVSVAWALTDDPTRVGIYAAYRRALQTVITCGENQVVFATRMGKGDVVPEDIRGIVATAFEHWDFRAGDPQLYALRSPERLIDKLMFRGEVDDLLKWPTRLRHIPETKSAAPTAEAASVEISMIRYADGQLHVLSPRAVPA